MHKDAKKLAAQLLEPYHKINFELLLAFGETKNMPLDVVANLSGLNPEQKEMVENIVVDMKIERISGSDSEMLLRVTYKQLTGLSQKLYDSGLDVTFKRPEGGEPQYAVNPPDRGPKGGLSVWLGIPMERQPVLALV